MDLSKVKDTLFPGEFDTSLTASQRFSAELRRKVFEQRRARSNDFFETKEELDEKIEAIAQYIRAHVEKNGIKCAAKDLQTAITALTKGSSNSILEEKQPLAEDGEFGEKTFAALAFICEHYDLKIILKYLQIGAVTNAIFDTKDDVSIDTDKHACETFNNIGEEW